jgi:hypothetical protein
VDYFTRFLYDTGFRFGSATVNAVKGFQNAKGIPVNGAVDNVTWDALVLPMVNAVSAGVSAGTPFDGATLAIARGHLQQRPLEVGGNNKGPWVRMYCGGHEGKPGDGVPASLLSY